MIRTDHIKAMDSLLAAVEVIEIKLYELRTSLAEENVELGRKGGLATAKRGPDYYRDIAAKRITKRGGRPKKVK